MNNDRRDFLKHAGMGVAIAAIVGPDLLLTPAEAKTRSVPLKVLDASELATLESTADVLLPGASAAGVGYFIDEQLSRDPNDSLLMARYLQVPPPYGGFYKGCAQALNGFAQTRHGKIFAQLPVALRQDLVASLFPQQPHDWAGPPSQLAYLCLRSDAIDVVYGTMEGFADLGIPYLAHIEPPAKW